MFACEVQSPSSYNARKELRFHTVVPKDHTHGSKHAKESEILQVSEESTHFIFWFFIRQEQ